MRLLLCGERKRDAPGCTCGDERTPGAPWARRPTQRHAAPSVGRKGGLGTPPGPRGDARGPTHTAQGERRGVAPTYSSAPAYRGSSFHSLRHCHATTLVALGGSLKAVSLAHVRDLRCLRPRRPGAQRDLNRLLGREARPSAPSLPEIPPGRGLRSLPGAHTGLSEPAWDAAWRCLGRPCPRTRPNVALPPSLATSPSI